MKASIYQIKSDHGARFKAEVRSFTYVGTFDSREEAAEACAHYMATGEKPKGNRRGPRGPRKKTGPRVKRVKPYEKYFNTETVTGSLGAVPIDRIAMMKQVYARVA